jgi:hypothetical protein
MQSRSSYAIASDAPLAYSLLQLYHTGSQEDVLVAVQEEQTRSDPQEIQAQEVPEVEEQEEDLPELWTINPVPSNEASPGAF